jgi:hypothetical protein
LLYLANDIMQNSRKEGNGYITEFMRVIPAALNEVLTVKDDFGRNVPKRLVCCTYRLYLYPCKCIITRVVQIVVLVIIITNVLTTSCPYLCAYFRGKVIGMVTAKLTT